MINKLPNKLTMLRKSLGYTQGDLASRLDVAIKDYMNWENGNSIPSFAHLQKLSILFNIPIELLMDNKKEISEELLDTLSKSVIIPSFMEDKKNDLDKTVDLGATDGDLGKTKVVSLIKDSEKRKEEIKEEVNKRKKISRKMLIIISSVISFVVVCAFLVFFFLRPTKHLNLSEKNRLALGNLFSIYIDDNGRVNIRGQLNNRAAFDDLVQVSAYGDHAVGLKKNGTVVSNGHEDVTKLKTVTMIAAGKDHILALNANGKVSCIGNQKACMVNEWQDVDKVFAGNGFSIGITKKKKVLLSGDVAGLSNLDNIEDIVTNDEWLLALHKNGQISSHSLIDNKTIDLSKLSGIKAVALTNEGVFGIDRSNKLQYVLFNEKSDIFNRKILDCWQNLHFIAGTNNTLVAIDNVGNMFGIGDNNNNQYENTASLSKPKVEKLKQVKNITFTETTANVNISWDRVENANRYHLVMDTDPLLDQKDILSNSYSIPANKLENGKTYKVTITALSDQSDKYDESDTTTINYTYKQKVIKLSTPSNLSNKITSDGWRFTWQAVEHADYYSIIFDGRLLVEKQIATNYHLDNTGIKNHSQHTLEIIAHSNTPEIYQDSDAYKSQLVYALEEYAVKFNFVKNGEKIGEKVYYLTHGNYVLGAIIQKRDLPSNTKLVDPTTHVDISGNQEQNVEVE